MPTIHIYDNHTREYLRTEEWTPLNAWVALPADATTLQPPAQREGFARVLNLAGDVWEHVEDHRGKAGFIEGQPHTVRDLGPLPTGWSDTALEVPLVRVKATKRAEITTGHDAALAGVVAISDPTPTTVAVEAALLAATDLTGLEYARQKLATRRAELLAAVNAATTVEVLDAVVVSYPV
ncbi:phage tail protein [Nitratidesulfovibrio vulgaris]|uniref:phage tail protein n=1 Tax=Nitratidesulfovibrio vulgaris TaxID=881 RepID=UPI00230045CF|nr:phage tail protein [Nitratidesulfovibrio vulgaris]WCB45285.1 phage tail protein [Nitratidesulfovibrio vulgaris]